MHDLQEEIALVVPCYNEASRLDLGAFEKFHKSVQFIFVNDGSSDETSKFLRSLPARNFHVLDLPQNVGKAEAVRQGILFANSLPNYSKLNWLGYWDADLATPLSEIPFMLRFVRAHERPVDAVLASRVYRLGGDIRRSSLRHIFGRAFATLIGVLLKVHSYDSQCGAKLFRPAAAEKAFATPFISKWIFDVEILLRLNDANLIECPIQRWQDVPGSKMKIGREAFRVLRDVCRIRKAFKAR